MLRSKIRPSRSLKDIKTATGNVEVQHLTYRSYFKMGALELEKLRKRNELHSANERAATIDKRLAEIDKEIDLILTEVSITPEIRNKIKNQQNRESLQSSDKLRLRY